jgi:hypothetical protein
VTGPVDIPLLRKAVEWAEVEAAKPTEQCQWYQGAYDVPAYEVNRKCGTCYCIAGWVCLVADGEVPEFGIGPRAAELLGIPDEHNYEGGLFWDTNTIEDVRRIAEGIAAEAGERL